ncbi:MAG: peptidylprolyl isomerase [Firmicutes bacterium]|nr:peptidylprolyl isomerase [Bacillota bacterium]
MKSVINKKNKKSGSKTGKETVNKNKYTLYVLIGIAVLIVIIAAVAGFSTYAKSYVASVGREKISVDEFRFFLEQEKDNMLAIAGNPDPETFWDTTITGGEKAIDIAKKKTLENIRELKIQLMKAREQKLSLDKTDLENIEASINSIIAQYSSKSAANSAYMEIYGISLDDFKEIYKDYLLRNKLVQKEMESIEASEDEIEEYYGKFPDAFKDSSYRTNGEEAVWVKHILILTVDKETQEELSGDKLEEAKKKAEDLLARAKKGEDFATLAKENSEDPGSAEHGGDYVFGKGYMMPEFEETSFKLEPGDIDMVKTDSGYHIIKLEEKIPQGEPVSLRCAKEYWEFGIKGVKVAKYMERLEEWKKDPKYKVVKNESVYNSIK